MCSYEIDSVSVREMCSGIGMNLHLYSWVEDVAVREQRKLREAVKLIVIILSLITKFSFGLNWRTLKFLSVQTRYM